MYTKCKALPSNFHFMQTYGQCFSETHVIRQDSAKSTRRPLVYESVGHQILVGVALFPDPERRQTEAVFAICHPVQRHHLVRVECGGDYLRG